MTATTTNSTKLTTSLSHKTWLGGSWTADDSVDVDRVSFSVAPEISKAHFRQEYGAIVDSETSPTGEYVAPLNLEERFVKIALSDGTNNHNWYGYVYDQLEAPAGLHADDFPISAAAGRASGVRKYVAAGLEYFLAKAPLQHAWMEAKTGWSSAIIDANLVFNAGRRQGRLVGNRSASMDGGIYKFSDTTGNQWTAAQVIEYLLKLWNATQYGTAFFLSSDSFHAALDYSKVWDFRGKTYAQALSELANPGYGMTWYVKGTDGYPEIQVQPVIAEDLPLGNQDVLPGSGQTIDLDLDSYQIPAMATINRLEDSHYHRVHAIGDPLRVCFTMGLGDGYDGYSNMEAAWTLEQKTAYDMLSTEADAAKDQYKGMYQSYQLKSDWDGEAGSYKVLCKINPDTGAIDTDTQVDNWARQAHRLDRTIPIEDENGEERDIFVIAQSAAGNWFDLTAPYPADVKAAYVRVVENELGFRIRSSQLPHYYGLNNYSGSLSGATVDYKSVLATVSMYTDEHVRIEKEIDDPLDETLKTKQILVPGAGYWYVVTGTAVDIDGASLATVDAADQVVRDDTATLQKVANLASVWYGQIKHQLEVDYQEGMLLDILGWVVNDITRDGETVNAGTIVSRVEYNFENQQSVKFKTAWADLDIRGLAGAAYDSTGIPRRDAGDYSEGSAYQPPLDAAGGSTVVFAKITSGAGDTYAASIYAEGPDQAATSTGETLKIPQIAAGAEIPAHTWVLAVLVGSTYWGQVPVWL